MKDDSTGMMSTVYTGSEVSRHNMENDLWIVYEDGVYDITKFLKEHPGGEEVLLNLGGQDATKCFDEIGHTVEAVQLRETYKIGTVTGSLAEEPAAATGVEDTTTEDDTYESALSENKRSPWLPIFIALGVVIYAVIFYYLWLS